MGNWIYSSKIHGLQIAWAVRVLLCKKGGRFKGVGVGNAICRGKG